MKYSQLQPAIMKSQTLLNTENLSKTKKNQNTTKKSFEGGSGGWVGQGQTEVTVGQMDKTWQE